MCLLAIHNTKSVWILVMFKIYSCLFVDNPWALLLLFNSDFYLWPLWHRNDMVDVESCGLVLVAPWSKCFLAHIDVS